jgi:hypothetical protein
MGVFKSKEEKKKLADERDAKYLAKLAKADQPKTDKELQESIEKNLKLIAKTNSSILFWVSILGWLAILGIVMSIIIAISAAS